jgi:hypothetical protein
MGCEHIRGAKSWRRGYYNISSDVVNAEVLQIGRVLIQVARTLPAALEKKLARLGLTLLLRALSCAAGMPFPTY